MKKKRFPADPLAVHNERVKLAANFSNSIALGFIGFAIIRPLVERVDLLSTRSLWWILLGLAFHGVSHYIIRNLRKEANE